MIVRIGETRQDVLRSGTYKSVSYIVQLHHNTVNLRLANSDFDAARVSVRAILKRSGKQHIIYQDNLKLLAAFVTLKKAFHEWNNGLDKVLPGAEVKHVYIRPVTIDFGTHIRVNAGDELILETAIAPAGVFSSAVDATASHIEFYANSGIGYEAGLPSITAEVVQQGSTKQSFNPGDNVTSLAFLNFDKDTLEDEIYTNIQLGSDRLDLGLSFNQAIANNALHYGSMNRERYGEQLPVTLGNQDIFRGLDFNPQSIFIFDGENGAQIDQVKLDISFNGANVSASQNYVVFRRVESSKEIVRAAMKRAQKHFDENFAKLPLTA